MNPIIEIEIKNKFENEGIIEYWDKIKPYCLETIKLNLIPSNDADIPIGKSKIGGLPDLPINDVWKSWKGKPMSFLAQINLWELEYKMNKIENILPKEGILYFFYTSEQDTWGFDPKDKDSFKVKFFQGRIEDIRRQEKPENSNEYTVFKSLQIIDFIDDISLPNNHEIISEIFGDDEDSVDKYYDIFSEEPLNKLLGNVDVIQNPMELECELVTNGIYLGGGYTDTRIKYFEGKENDWQLLFQLDSNDEIDMMWGDCGKLYFWIKKQDLENNNFDNVWCILQCY